MTCLSHKLYRFLEYLGGELHPNYLSDSLNTLAPKKPFTLYLFTQPIKIFILIYLPF